MESSAALPISRTTNIGQIPSAITFRVDPGAPQIQVPALVTLGSQETNLSQSTAIDLQDSQTTNISNLSQSTVATEILPQDSQASGLTTPEDYSQNT